MPSMLLRFSSLLRFFLCCGIVFFIPLTVSSQTLTAKNLIDRFKISDVNQTWQFDKAAGNLHLNFDEASFKQQISGVRNYLLKNTDTRVQIRLFLYERIGYMKMNVLDKENTKANYFKIIKLAGLLGDEQLLSDIYRRFANLFVNSERLYYLLKCIEIRERIGVQYFSDLSANYFEVSSLLYQITDYKSSASYAARCLALFRENDKREFLFQYILATDVAGASYLKINKPDSAIYYYKYIDKLIGDRILHPKKYKSPMSSAMLKIWEGVVKGGIAKAYIVQKEYDRAYVLLMQNLESSTKFGQWDNVADVENELAALDSLRSNVPAALKKYLNAYRLASKSGKLSTLIKAAQGAATNFASLKQYDSAYVYYERYLVSKTLLDDQTNQSRLDLLKTQVNFEQSQKELLQSKNSLINQKRIRNFVLIAIVFLTIVALLLYNRKRLQVNLQNEKMQRQKQQSAAEMAYAQQQIDFVVRNIAEKNKLISQLKSQVFTASHSEIISALTDFTILTDKDWRKFKTSFETVNPNFLDRLKEKMPNVTQGEQRIISLAKLGFSTKEMANATGVSPETIRSVISRMRKKLNLDIDIHTFANEI